MNDKKMYLYRNNNCKGIVKKYCPKCNSAWYVSLTGTESGPDRMYNAALALLTKESVPVTLSREEDDNERFIFGYEFDNDYENKSIIHRVSGIDYNKKTCTAKYVKGQSYYDFIDKLFSKKMFNQCPYCGCPATNKIYSVNFSPYKNSDALNDREKELLTIARRITDPTEFEREAISLPAKVDSLDSHDLKEYLRNLVCVEKNVSILEKRLWTLAVDYADYSGTMKHSLLGMKYPNARMLSESCPPEPAYLEPGFFNAKKIATQNEARRQEYENTTEYINFAKKMQDYIEIKESQYRHAGMLAQELDKKILTGEIDQYEALSSAVTKVVRTLSPEVFKCLDLLRNAIHIRRKLYATGIIHDKYKGLVPVSTMLEYLECGRCTTLEGPYGAYNLYENDVKYQVINNKLDTIISELEQIRKNQYLLYQSLQSINATLSDLNANTQSMIKGLRNIQSGIDQITYNTNQNMYYSRIAAENSSISAFIDTYNFWKS